jgi:hypothetical protein
MTLIKDGFRLVADIQSSQVTGRSRLDADIDKRATPKGLFHTG